jgi:hypothetical protein
MIYLASPYNDSSPAVQEQRFEEVCRVVGDLISRGLLVYSPIAHNHVIARLANIPTTWSIWKKHDLAMLSYCDSLWILTLDGWKNSIGIKEEIKWWIENRPQKPVDFI